MMECVLEWSLVAAVCLGIGGAIYWLKKNQEHNKQSLMPTGVGNKDVECSKRDIAPFPKNDFVKNVLKFTGTFEPLYNAVHKSDISSEDKTNIYQDWCLRLRTVCNDAVYTKWTTRMSRIQISERLELLLQEIVSCGVVRDDRVYLIVDDDTARQYIDWEGIPLVIGDKMRIASASWTLHGKCIEKGIVTKNNVI